MTILRPIKAKPKKGSNAAAIAARGRRKISFELTPDAHELLRQASLERGTPQIRVLEQLIRKYLDHEVSTFDAKLY